MFRKEKKTLVFACRLRILHCSGHALGRLDVGNFKSGNIVCEDTEEWNSLGDE